ncbi:hypothetical protein F1B92_05890 [Campylobacter sp. FMV-PI01]|uniref:Restriction endonuclease n=1 Tax=Campylobacter portucalensis TaxID=2608384 RepID=A0A6L5WI09_9BACT|nr:hypothetical protein [Campylobacter portucalensis]MSN96694.1 hypothetical protein [Campylobacter portucalensis]
MWEINDEITFFKNALESNFANKKDIFYEIDGEFFAYIPKKEKRSFPTLQSRNSLIGKYTEIWCQKLFKKIAQKFGLFAINGVICEEIGLIPSSRADLAFCSKDSIIQKPKDIKIIFEIKMSIVNNYKLLGKNIEFIGDYKTHKALPSLIRSDSVLKAIGKSVNIRVSSPKANQIPIVILGNTHLSDNYMAKVDYLGQSGVLQQILSLNPNLDIVKNSNLGYFRTIKNTLELENIIEKILAHDLTYFSAMISKEKLAKLIKNSALQKDEISIANYFLDFIKDAKI